SSNFSDKIDKSGTKKLIEITANNNRLDSQKILEFAGSYLNTLFGLNKKRWMLHYDIVNKLGDEAETIDAIEWAKKKLSFPGISQTLNREPSQWDRILETYIRTFSMNLIKSEVYYYLKINRGTRIDPAFWSKRLRIEKTLLHNKMEYIIYHNDDASA